METDVSVAVLAGGFSRRMGQDKAFVPVQQRPMIERVLDVVRELSDDVTIITNQPQRFARLGAPLVGDRIPGCGALGGLYTALLEAQRPHVLVVACDMPWLNRPLLEYLLSLRATAEIVVPVWQERRHPLHAVYRRTCAQAILPRLQAGQLQLQAFVRSQHTAVVPPEVVARYDPQGRSLININSPAELATWGK